MSFDDRILARHSGFRTPLLNKYGICAFLFITREEFYIPDIYIKAVQEDKQSKEYYTLREYIALLM